MSSILQELKVEIVDHGFILTDDTRLVVDKEAGMLKASPFIGHDGQVGLHLEHESGRVEYIYFNVSNGGDGTEGPGSGPGYNTFVYQGPTGEPGEDEPQHFYYLLEDE